MLGSWPLTSQANAAVNFVMERLGSWPLTSQANVKSTKAGGGGTSPTLRAILLRPFYEYSIRKGHWSIRDESFKVTVEARTNATSAPGHCFCIHQRRSRSPAGGDASQDQVESRPCLGRPALFACGSLILVRHWTRVNSNKPCCSSR